MHEDATQLPFEDEGDGHKLRNASSPRDRKSQETGSLLEPQKEHCLLTS